MAEATPDISAVDALLDEVAALDMALLRHVNAVALATTDPDTLNGLVRSQQRLARSVRTTLTTKARLAAKRNESGAPGAKLGRFGPFPWQQPTDDSDEPRLDSGLGDDEPLAPLAPADPDALPEPLPVLAHAARPSARPMTAA